MKKNIIFLISVSLILIILSSLPYFYGQLICPSDGVFTGYTKNIDDMAVYGSWVKQAQNHFFLHNLFQENPDGGKQINIYFNVLGIFSRLILRNAPNITLHIFRILQIPLLVFVFWLFTGLWTDKINIRKISLIVFLFGSGFGYFLKSGTTIDVWQPEAITFTSVYLNPLFSISLILIIGIYYALRKLENTQKGKYIVFSALFLLLLGNIHTYDCVNIYAVWGIYLIYRVFAEKNFVNWIKKSYKEICVLLIGLATPLYNLYLYMNDPIYKMRADTPIVTHPIYDIILGYGLVFVFALIGIFILCKGIELKKYLPLAIWAVVNLLTIYIPFSQQRKFIMGYEIPLALLGAYGIYMLLKNIQYKKYIFALCVIIMFLTNLSVMQTDMDLLAKRTTQAKYCPYLSLEEKGMINQIIRLGDNITEGSIFAPPQLALFIPEYTGKNVYYGHWSETPDFSERAGEYIDFSKTGKTENQKIKYIILENNLKLDKKLPMIYNNYRYTLFENRY